MSALAILRSWVPRHCSQVQAICIKQLLELTNPDFVATLADATEDGDFRLQLYRQAANLAR